MTVAFNDVVLLSKLLAPEAIPLFQDTRLVMEQMKTFHWRRKSLSSVINILAQALYSLFAAKRSPRRVRTGPGARGGGPSTRASCAMPGRPSCWSAASPER